METSACAAVQVSRHPAAPLGITDDHFRSVWASALQQISKSLAQPLPPPGSSLSAQSPGGPRCPPCGQEPRQGVEAVVGGVTLGFRGRPCAHASTRRRRRGWGVRVRARASHSEPQGGGHRAGEPVGRPGTSPSGPSRGPHPRPRLCSGGTPHPAPKARGYPAPLRTQDAGTPFLTAWTQPPGPVSPAEAVGQQLWPRAQPGWAKCRALRQRGGSRAGPEPPAPLPGLANVGAAPRFSRLLHGGGQARGQADSALHPSFLPPSCPACLAFSWDTPRDSGPWLFRGR